MVISDTHHHMSNSQAELEPRSRNVRTARSHHRLFENHPSSISRSISVYSDITRRGKFIIIDTTIICSGRVGILFSRRSNSSIASSPLLRSPNSYIYLYLYLQRPNIICPTHRPSWNLVLATFEQLDRIIASSKITPFLFLDLFLYIVISHVEVNLSSSTPTILCLGRVGTSFWRRSNS